MNHFSKKIIMERKAGREDMPLLTSIGKKDFFFFEQIKALRARFESKIVKNQYNVVAITSAIPGEGKTLISANLAANLATIGKRKILLIDADLRKSGLTHNMEIKQSPGLAEFLTETIRTEDIIHNSKVPGLYVIPSGMTPPDPTLLLAGEKFQSLVDVFSCKTQNNSYSHIDSSEQYFVILDTPPVLPVADTINLRDRVDGFVFVYRAGFTPHRMFKKAIEDIGVEKIFGVIINGVESQKDYYYRKYYGEYHKIKTTDAE
jgi:capsular exopolysaccharide synthesis family protein